MDRFLGVLATFLALFCFWMGFTSWSGWLILWAIVLGIWVATGFKYVEVGWRAQVLLFGERTTSRLGEGWRWVPIPFGLKSANCKRQTNDFDKMEATTRDNVKVFVGGSAVFQITDLDTYFGVEGEDLNKWLDKTRQELVRGEIRRHDQEEVLGMHESLGNLLETALRNRGSEHWGIIVYEVILPEITPDSKTGDDLALRRREELQRDGQRIEADHASALIALFKKPVEEGGTGLSEEEAVRQARLVLGQATPVNTQDHRVSFSPVIMQAITEILRKVR